MFQFTKTPLLDRRGAEALRAGWWIRRIRCCLMYHPVSRSGCHPSYPGGELSLSDSHLPIDICERFSCDRTSLFGAGRKDRIERRVVIFFHALLKWSQEFDDGLGKLSLEMPVAFALEMSFGLFGRFPGKQVIDRQQVCDRRPRRFEADISSRIGDRAFDLFRYGVGIVEQEDRTVQILIRLRHLFLGFLQRADLRTDWGDVRVGE